MRDYSLAQVSITVFAIADVALGMSAAMSQGLNPAASPKAADQDSARSFPPDTTHYVRPVIPEDRVSVPNLGRANMPSSKPNATNVIFPGAGPK